MSSSGRERTRYRTRLSLIPALPSVATLAVSGKLYAMAILLSAVLVFAVMRLAIPALKPAGNFKLAMLAVPGALGGWLLMSLITNLAWRARLH